MSISAEHATGILQRSHNALSTTAIQVSRIPQGFVRGGERGGGGGLGRGGHETLGCTKYDQDKIMIEAKSHIDWPSRGLSRGTPDLSKQAYTGT